MPRLPRIHIEGAVYLVTSRGGGTEPVFRDQQDYETYLGLLGEYKARYGFKLYAYCLLPDHLTLCLDVPSDTTVSAVMHDLTSRYTKYVNRRYGRSGHLFQQRFKSVIVEKTGCLLPITAHVHRIPVQLGLVREFSEYRFSSAVLYADPSASASGLQLTQEVQDVIAELRGDHTPQAYLQHVRDTSVFEAKRLSDALRFGTVGSDAFIQRVKSARLRAALGPGELSNVSPELQSNVSPELQSAIRNPQSEIRETAAAQPAEPPPAPVESVRIVREVAAPSPFIPALMGALAFMLLVFGMTSISLYQRIGTLQQTVSALSHENEAAFLSRHGVALARPVTDAELAQLAGSEWEIRMVPVSGQAPDVERMRLAFTRSHVTSPTLASEGFPTANYHVGVDPRGALHWETVQGNAHGELVSWKGEWQGKAMRGVMTRETAGGSSEEYTFIGVPAQAPQPVRSET